MSTSSAQSVELSHNAAYTRACTISDHTARFVGDMAVKRLAQAGFAVRGSKTIVAGLAFKKNVPELRNSKVADLVAELGKQGLDVHVYDPVVDADEAVHEYSVHLEPWERLPRAELVGLTVPHRELLSHPLSDYAAKAVRGALFVDVKSRLEPQVLSTAGFTCWRCDR